MAVAKWYRVAIHPFNASCICIILSYYCLHEAFAVEQGTEKNLIPFMDRFPELAHGAKVAAHSGTL